MAHVLLEQLSEETPVADFSLTLVGTIDGPRAAAHRDEFWYALDFRVRGPGGHQPLQWSSRSRLLEVRIVIPGWLVCDARWLQLPPSQQRSRLVGQVELHLKRHGVPGDGFLLLRTTPLMERDLLAPRRLLPVEGGRPGEFELGI